MLPRGGFSASAGIFRGDCKNEETLFVTLMAVIVVTNAMKSKHLRHFPDVTRATSPPKPRLRNGCLSCQQSPEASKCGLFMCSRNGAASLICNANGSNVSD